MTAPQKNEKSSTLPDFPAMEERVLQRWNEKYIFQKTLEQTRQGRRFVFFEGPPTANGAPHMGHVETRAFKDIILRYKTMRGFFVERKAGWDTQGLPVELEIEKQLAISGKKQIEEYGVAKFNAHAKESVWKYKDLWEQMSERIGFWLDYSDPYITYTNNYIETLWWIFSKIWEQKLLEKDFKVVPYCPRCETALSSHEVAQGYQSVTEPSVYVKFELVDEPGTYVLAWTTTPWTLPGNVALAVGEKIQYVKVKVGTEQYILAKDRLSVLDGTDDVVQEMNGKDLVGKKYKPLFDFLDLEKESDKKAYYIAPADFVSTADGTGVVHTAVMYGIEDYDLGKQIDLPMVHTVDLTGRFTDLVTPWKGLEVKDEKGETQRKVTEYLKEKKLLYKAEDYTHDYPFCWRCSHPLLYYAKTSWFIRMSQLRDQLIANNQKINWHPANIKEGRFGEWLREVKDWAISRERYWGTPLPIWQCDNADCKHQECMGSFAELAKKIPSRNRYFFVRHGESEMNVRHKINASPKEKDKYPLTDKGRQDAAHAADQLRNENITAIYCSPMLRTRQTADILAGATHADVREDVRLSEGFWGDEFEGKTIEEACTMVGVPFEQRYKAKTPHGETPFDIQRRMVQFCKEMEEKHEGKTFVIVSHGDPIFIAAMSFDFTLESRIYDISDKGYPEKGVVREEHFPGAMYQDNGTFDPHRPFVDALTFTCSTCKSGTMRRIPEVADTWFDSGSMPFAQWHYPFENKERIEQGTSYPADFITEAVDQTRGWFYTLVAIAALLQKAGVISEPPYKDVIVLGLLNDAEGKKLSKRLGNYIDPMEMVRAYGADAVRFYLYSINQPWESKNFDRAGVGDVVRKNFLIVWNVVHFWELAGGGAAQPVSAPSTHLLDVWLEHRTNRLLERVTRHLDAFEVTEASRLLSDYINILSTWYVRRSRDRMKRGNAERDHALTALRGALLKLATVLAPFTPYLAEMVYERVGGTRESVHLEPWPTFAEPDDAVLTGMDATRQIVEGGHALREESKIRIRQPLEQLVVIGQPVGPEHAAILCDELNVKEVVVAKAVPTGDEWKSKTFGSFSLALNTLITDELLHEGWVREVVRNGNELRKKAGLRVGDRATFTIQTDDDTVRGVLTHYRDTLVKDIGAEQITFGDTQNPVVEKEFKLGTATVVLSILKQA